MRKENSVFSAKILLFGEYTVIFDSKALTIPYSYFNGRLSFIGEDKYTRYDMALQSNRELVLYHDYLVQHQSLVEEADLAITKMKEDLSDGMYFESNIPQGFGVGSSGALVAAIYEKYSRRKKAIDDPGSIRQLKHVFSLMESYFHGTSSGMDPLNCYIGEPLLFSSNDNIRRVAVPNSQNNGDGAIFLINSGYPSTTEPLVKKFLNKTLNQENKKVITDELIPLNDTCIDQITSGNMISFFDSLRKMSALQAEVFREMIPARFAITWENGLDTADYYLKLCGSGGGGFLLGFTCDYRKAKDILLGEGLEIMPVFKNSSFRNEDKDEE